MRRALRRVGRRWVALVVLALVPVVIVTNPSVANAATATSYGSAQSVHWTWGNLPKIGGGYDCGATVYYVQTGAATAVGVKGGECLDGFVTTGYDVGDARSHTALAFTGVDDAGASCQVSADMSHTDDGGGNFTFSGVSSTTSAGCNVASYCWHQYIEGSAWDFLPNGGVTEKQGCADLSMGPHPKAVDNGDGSTACPQGIRPTDVRLNILPVPYNHNWSIDVYTKGVLPDGYAIFNSPLVYSNDVNGAGAGYFWHQDVFRASLAAAFGSTGQGVSVPGHPGPDHWHADPSSTGFIGSGMWDGVTADHITGIGVEVWVAPASQDSVARINLGINDPSTCSWYFGRKLADDPSATGDDPAGELLDPASTDDPAPGGTGTTGSGTEPTATPVDHSGAASGCTFAISDPSTWLSGGMCAAVGLLGAILNTISGLPAAVMSLLGDLLKSLFVPSQAAVSSFGDGAQQTVRSSSVGGWDDAVSGGFASLSVSETGCQGPQIAVPASINAGGVLDDWHPLAACSGTAQKLANWCHLICTALLCVFGGVKLLRIILDSLGLGSQTRLIADGGGGT